MSLKHRVGRLAVRLHRVRSPDSHPELCSILAEDGPPEELRRYGPTRWLILRVPGGTPRGRTYVEALAPEQRARIGPRTKLYEGHSPDKI
jgi:hypothetical protein